MLALTKVEINFFNLEQGIITIPADSIIIVDLHNGVAQFRGDHFDIDCNEFTMLV